MKRWLSSARCRPFRPRHFVILALVERALHLRRPPARFGFGEAKLLFPTLGRLMPECPILRIDRVPFMLAAFFDLLSEGLLPIKWHGAPLTEQGRLSRGDGLADLGLQMSPSSRQPLTARRSNPNVNCADARANQWRLVKSLRVLQIRHYPKISMHLSNRLFAFWFCNHPRDNDWQVQLCPVRRVFDTACGPGGSSR
jgi:hypothetical protein